MLSCGVSAHGEIQVHPCAAKNEYIFGSKNTLHCSAGGQDEIDHLNMTTTIFIDSLSTTDIYQGPLV